MLPQTFRRARTEVKKRQRATAIVLWRTRRPSCRLLNGGSLAIAHPPQGLTDAYAEDAEAPIGTSPIRLRETTT